MSALVWIHEDAIRASHPVMDVAGEGAQAVFIWDTSLHQAREYSLKRLVFIYECAAALDIPIYAGRTEDILAQLAEGRPIYAARTPDLMYRDIIEDLEITEVDDDVFIDIPSDTDVKRFFRFWKMARKSALKLETT